MPTGEQISAQMEVSASGRAEHRSAAGQNHKNCPEKAGKEKK